MTVRRVYACDLCRESIRPTEGAIKDGIGIRFAVGRFTFYPVSEVDRHLCFVCAASAHDEMRNITPADKREMSK